VGQITKERGVPSDERRKERGKKKSLHSGLGGGGFLWERRGGRRPASPYGKRENKRKKGKGNPSDKGQRNAFTRKEKEGTNILDGKKRSGKKERQLKK